MASGVGEVNTSMSCGRTSRPPSVVTGPRKDITNVFPGLS
jgi:hypothetical protein